MKKTDLEKARGLKIMDKMQRAGSPERYGQAAALPDRREQRRREQALGLVPFAVKLDGELVKQLQALAQARGAPMNEVVAELLRKGLAAPAGD